MLSVIDTGNITSLSLALDRIGAPYTVTTDPTVVASSDGIIFPGQGRAGTTLQLLEQKGLRDILASWTRPYLGICLGMQLLGDFSEEDDIRGLGVFPGVTTKFRSSLPNPHMGWNPVRLEQPSPLTTEITDQTCFYFVHSYFLDSPVCDILATTDYGVRFPAIIQSDNFYGVQFHPEKSGPAGIQLLTNFVTLCSSSPQ